VDSKVLKISSAILAAVVLGSATVYAQSLADVARAEEARRKAVKGPSKVYTNENLARNGDGSPTSAPAPAAATQATAATAVKPAEPAKADPAKPEQPPANAEPKKDEKYWNARITSARDALNHDKVLADALQSRINALTTDFANASDPVQRSVIEENRKTALAELDRVTKDIDKQTKSIADIQEEARKAGAPPGWLR
jgi:hypothetical protein